MRFCQVYTQRLVKDGLTNWKTRPLLNRVRGVGSWCCHGCVPDASEFGILQRLPGAVLTEISVATIMLATQRVDQANVSAGVGGPCCLIAGPL